MSTDLTEALDLDAIRDRVDTVLADFLRRPPSTVPSQRGHGDELAQALRDFVLAPGKRIRSLLCVLGWQAAGGGDGEQALWQTAASLEVFHAFALIHDDIIDSSQTRRGRPSVHRAFAARHRARPDADAFGVHAAVLLGDLALTCSDTLMHRAGLSARQRDAVLPLIDAMRGEVLLGQYMDLMATGRPTDDVEHALTIARLKTAKYTVERPLHVGAALAGADGELLGLCSAFALPLGEAFQLRDDLLGVFGDPALTGKPVLDDLRSGKATVLMALAMRHATPSQRRTLEALVGRPDLDAEDAVRVRRILQRTGARDMVEGMISERYETALRTLDTALLTPQTVHALRHIATRAVVRTT
ncbi:polyprenyl synthetase family protein [Streptomyces sp. ISL-22]|uniref:polyprenyl synthetase family protein n=1 Tax=unclassified Streptomyces TaxID=2593676 RepID=UPI001BEC2EBE|nr:MULTISPECIES: polyprenyl synthetase family protein [unclassified Streptomyces]MBT2422741.1 polyprenyl synthetase family protein [Streptomyces sp. ISL-24]MBT2435896.1 polyprenyl synthetase family protein [Streptomyces sp. ISL-22]